MYIENELMLEIKEYLESKKYNVIEIVDNETQIEYLLTPSFIIFRNESDYILSFDISVDKAIAISIFIEVQGHFGKRIMFTLFDDCIVDIDEYGEVDFIRFGDKAIETYYHKIYNNIKSQLEIPKNVTWQ